VRRDRARPDVVRAARRRALARLLGGDHLTLVEVAVVGTLLADDARSRHTVDPPYERRDIWPAALRRDERLTTLVVDRVDARSVDVVVEKLCGLLFHNQPRSLVAPFFGGVNGGRCRNWRVRSPESQSSRLSARMPPHLAGTHHMSSRVTRRRDAYSQLERYYKIALARSEERIVSFDCPSLEGDGTRMRSRSVSVICLMSATR